jgi:hypothetical protein
MNTEATTDVHSLTPSNPDPSLTSSPPSSPTSSSHNSSSDEPWMPPNYNLILKSMKKLQLDSPHPRQIPINLLASSSVDYNQVPSNVLGTITHSKDSKFGNFWSSDGSLAPTDNEFLLFSSRHDKNEIFLLDRIDILFHVEACHQYPHNVYHSDRIRVSVGYVEGVWESVIEVGVKDKEDYLRKGYFPIELEEHVFCRYVFFLGGKGEELSFDKPQLTNCLFFFFKKNFFLWEVLMG